MELPTSWTRVKDHLVGLPDTTAQIAYLLEVMTECQHSEIPTNENELFIKRLTDRVNDLRNCSSLDPRYDFHDAMYRNCEIELEKLRRFQELSGSQNSKEETERNPEFTTARQVLAMYYIFENAKLRNVSSIDKARFIEFLTGKSLDNITKCLANPHKEKRSENAKDLKYVKKFFEKLGMTEIVKAIDEELDEKTGNWGLPPG